ncbi:unnamed protein product [Dibothriocephalus latus]|uniref:protein disulfide-isomerase n=1 Tax=Dibothriocephalus latus TaxID=60516 RepID=A0A3P7LHV0_DIBLA|nr:unnamed protein product [Dibothriocephalus latus]
MESLLSLFLFNCHGLYSSDQSVSHLTSSNFDDFTSSPGVSIVKFYASWCGHCEQLAPKYKQAAAILKGIVRFGAVDCDKQSELSERYKVKGYPTILIFRDDKSDPIQYKGERDASSITKFLLEQVTEVVEHRGKKEGVTIKKPSQSTGGTCGGSSGGSSRGSSSGSDSKGDGSVIELTDSNFDDLVLKSQDEWLVSFYAPWCPHCKSLKPQWELAAKKLGGKMKLGAIDATIHQSLAQRYSIKGFPTIKLFPAGVKSGAAGDYDGGRSAEDIVAWALKRLAKNKPPPEVLEITSNTVLQNACTEKQLCIIAVLPHLLDCQSKCRNKYIDLLKKSAEKFKENDWGWLWAPARSHPDLEKTLEMGGFGYPALAAVNARKLKCAVMRGSFSDSGIHEFLRDLSQGRSSVPLIPVSRLPELKTVEPWDGKDAPVVETEKIDLSELGIKTEL